MTDRVFILAPAGLVTGGPEALHQLGDAINRRQPGRAAMLYRPFNGRHEVPKPFRRYTVAAVQARESMAGATVVAPETSADMIGAFPASATIHMWWLSVDRFFELAGPNKAAQLRTIADRVTRHLYQSEYARRFLQRAGLGPACGLSDYLAGEYGRAAAHPTRARRDDIIAYNPAKGAQRTATVLAALGGRSPHVVPITGMSRNQIRQLLKRAKVYIDFGEHPGKDRIPREAAALGACVLTNRRGAADNPVDVPIPGDYKIDDHQPGFEKVAAAKIRELLGDFEAHQPRFEPYRRWISGERVRFCGDVDTNYAPT